MADYVDGDEQLQDAFEEGNGDANNDEVCGRRVSSTIWQGNFCCSHPSGCSCSFQELVSMRARLVQLEDEKKRMEEHTVRHNPSLAFAAQWLVSMQI